MSGLCAHTLHCIKVASARILKQCICIVVYSGCVAVRTFLEIEFSTCTCALCVCVSFRALQLVLRMSFRSGSCMCWKASF